MARIPIYDRQRGLTAGATSPTMSSASPVGEALGGLGKAIAAYAKDQERLDDFEDERRFEALKQGESTRFLEAQNEAQPGARDFTRGFVGGFEENAARYIGETPERLRPQAEYRVAQLRRSLAVNATQWELNERERYIKTETGTMLDRQLRSATPENLDSMYARADEIIGKAGLSPIDADLARKAFRQNAQAAAVGKLMPPGERHKAIDGAGPMSFEQRLIQRESGGRADVVNPLGYAGLYQFGAPRLSHLGLYKPGPNEDLRSWSANRWSGSFDLAGFPEVRTLQDFLANPDAQRFAYRKHVDQMNREISSAGLDRYEGQTISGVLITRAGLHAMLHIGGLGSTKKALESGGKTNPQDANQTSVLDYARMAVGATSIHFAKFSDIPYEQRVRLAEQAQREQNALDRETEREDTQLARDLATRASKDGIDHVRNGTLSEEWLSANRDILDEADYKSFSQALSPGAGQTDDGIYADLLTRADDQPDEVEREATTAFARRQLDRDDYTRIVGKVDSERNRRESQERRRPQWYQPVKDFVIYSLRPNPFDYDGKQARRQQEAVLDFEQWQENNEGVSLADARKQATEIVNQVKEREAQEALTTTARPEYLTVPIETATLEDIEKAKKATRRAFKKGNIPDEDALYRQIKMLEAIEEALRRKEQGNGRQ